MYSVVHRRRVRWARVRARSLRWYSLPVASWLRGRPRSNASAACLAMFWTSVLCMSRNSDSDYFRTYLDLVLLHSPSRVMIGFIQCGTWQNGQWTSLISDSVLFELSVKWQRVCTITRDSSFDLERTGGPTFVHVFLFPLETSFMYGQRSKVPRSGLCWSFSCQSAPSSLW